jgi:hypothetical protein
MSTENNNSDPESWLAFVGLLLALSLAFAAMAIFGPLCGAFIFLPWLFWKIYKVDKSKNNGP